ncbi:MAG: hypothetical protein HUJ86_07145, partial [Synergistes sp.]|nr:hypothetical protein [Synergistes sp.]
GNEKLLAESRKLENSIETLNKQAETLRTDVQRLREGRIAAFTGEMLAQDVINNTVITESQVQSAVERLRYETRALLAYRFGGKKPDTLDLPKVTPESVKKVTERLTHEPGRWMLRLIALENAVEGEAVLTKLEAFPSSLIYKNGHLLYSHTFKPDTPREKIEDTVFLALRSLNQKAVNDGVLRDPLTGNVGSIDSGEFAEALDEIAESKSKIKLEIYTARDIYSEGPLLVKFKLK